MAQSAKLFNHQHINNIQEYSKSISPHHPESFYKDRTHLQRWDWLCLLANTSQSSLLLRVGKVADWLGCICAGWDWARCSYILLMLLLTGWLRVQSKKCWVGRGPGGCISVCRSTLTRSRWHSYLTNSQCSSSPGNTNGRHQQSCPVFRPNISLSLW